MSPTIRVRVPGSTSNCGAGFDTLGLGLRIYNSVTLKLADAGGAQPARECDGLAAALVERVCQEYAAAGQAVPAGFSYQIDGEVPVSRGLGSSITVLAGVLAGLNAAAGAPLNDDEQVRILTRIEGHPDNATAGVWGGFCVSRCGATAADYLDAIRINIPESLKFVVVSPDLEIATHGSRKVLPEQISHGDAVRSVNSAAFLTAAFATGNFSRLRGAAGDFLHEPYRLPGIPGAAEAIHAGENAGALTGWLSGSGSSVLCVTEAGQADAVGAAMKQTFADSGSDSTVRVLTADNEGLQVSMD